mmetsp:Transcript_5717/g.16345  ORF Transcript_5717/g.16345 Transcript_5717/m.16345 type:complete len:591 (+) Transcript_5717:231-2003(+)
MQSAAEPEVAAAESALAMIPAPSALKHRSSSGDGNGGDRSSSGASGNGPERKLSKVLTFSPHALVIQPEWERRLQRLANAIVRGAGAGFCLRGGLNLVAFLFALVARRRKVQQARRGSLSAQWRDALRYTSFLGAFAGIYVSVDEGIAALFGNRRTAGWRAAVAGAAAGPTILLTGPKTRHTSLALYVLIRGISLLIRCGNKPSAPPAIRKLLTLTRWRHGDTALMCLSTSQIGYSWLMHPNTLPPAYINFLNRHGGAEVCKYRAVQELAERNAAGKPLGRLKALQGTQHAHFRDRIPCGFLHAGHSCTGHTAVFLPRSYLRSLPVYIPVYLLPALLVHRQKLVVGPQAPQIWAKAAAAAARSSLFLSLYCTLAWRGACVGHQVTGNSTGFILAASCWTGGLATLVEKKSRRMELAFYCLSRAAESFALCLREWGWVKRDRLPKRLDVLLFSAATAAILHCYSDGQGSHRDVFRSKYLAVFDFIFGNTDFEGGRIKHVPSTSDMLAGALPEAGRRAASELGGALGAGLASDYESHFSSPRSDASSDQEPAPFRGFPRDPAPLAASYSQSLLRPPSGAGLSRRHLDADQGP